MLFVASAVPLAALVILMHLVVRLLTGRAGGDEAPKG